MKKAMALMATVLFAAALVSPAFAKGDGHGHSGPRKKGKSFQGKVTAVDSAKGTVTLEKGKKDEKESKTFQLPKDIKIKVNKEKATLADVKVGMRGNVGLEEDGKTIKSFTAGDPKPRGKGGKKKKSKKVKDDDE